MIDPTAMPMRLKVIFDVQSMVDPAFAAQFHPEIAKVADAAYIRVVTERLEKEYVDLGKAVGQLVELVMNPLVTGVQMTVEKQP